MKTTQQTILQPRYPNLNTKSWNINFKKSQNTNTLILISRVGTSISKNFALEIAETWSKTNDDATKTRQLYKRGNQSKHNLILNINNWKSISLTFEITETWSKINDDITTTRQQFYKRSSRTNLNTNSWNVNFKKLYRLGLIIKTWVS